jgi:hypothetical protein
MLRHKIIDGKQNTLSTAHFDSCGSAPVQYEVHLPMQHVQGYTSSLWMPPLVNCLLRIAPAAARVTGKQNIMKKYTYFVGCFDGHGNAPVRYQAHCSMEEAQGFTRSNWMQPLGKYLLQ